MIRQTPMSDRDTCMASSPDDNIERSSTEQHVIQSSRGMSVADHPTPDLICGRETPKMDADPNVEKYKLLNESPMWNVLTSPRKMNSRVYAPLPFIKCDMPAPESDHKAEPKVDVATPDSEGIVHIDTQSPELSSVKLPRIYSPVPYSRYNTSYSPVKWQKPVETSVQEEKQPNDQRSLDILELEKKLLSEIPASNDNSARSAPVPPVKANDVHDNTLTVASNKTTSVKRTSEKTGDSIVTETSQEQCNSDTYVRAENDIKQKENRRNEQLIKMKPTEKQQCATKRDTTVKQSSKKTTRATKQNKLRKPANVSEPKTTAVKENIKSEDTQEMQELKKVYEAHLIEKEVFEKFIEKRENELNEQLREMDEVMGSIYSEHAEIEKATGAFAEAVKTHTNYKDEASRVRVQHMEQEISSDILFEENAEMKEEIRELYDQINEIKERRAVGLHDLRQDTEEMKCAAEQLKSKNEEVEVETKKKMEEFNSLRMIMTDKDITSDKKGEILQKVDGVVAFPIPSISKSPPLVSLNMISSQLKINITDTDNASPDIGTPRNYNTTESGRLSKWVSEQNLAVFTENGTVERNEYGKGLISERSQKRDHNMDVEVDVLKPTKTIGEKIREDDVPVCEVEDEGPATVRIIPEVPVRQMPAAEAERSLGVHERKSRIPKPLVRPYVCASKESERYKASEGSPLIMAQRKTSQNKRDEFKDNKIRLTGDGLNKYSIKKIETAPKRCKKKEIQTKIDTGLKNRPSNVAANKSRKIVDAVAKMDKTTARKDTMKESAPMKHSNRGAITKEQACLSTKKPDLPLLKIMSETAKNANNVPRPSSSFENKTPLPNIKPANQQMNDLNKTSEKKATEHHVLQPTKSSKMNHVTNPVTTVDIAKRPTQMSSKKQAPEAMLVSFSLTPPSNATRSRKPSYRTQKLQIPRQNNNRASSERA